MSVAKSELSPVVIVSTQIVDVDPSAWTMTLKAEAGERQFYNVPIPSLYLHPFDGEGIHFMPEPGAYVWAMLPSEGDTRAVPLSYKPLNDERGGLQNGRPAMNGGDIILQTRDRNGINVRRGGVVEVYSTPMCRTFYLPLSNEVRTFAENWRVDTLGGSLRFNTSRPEMDPDGLLGTKVTLSAKEFADHPNPAFDLQIGGQIGDTEDILDLRVWQDSTIDTNTDGPLRESFSVVGDRVGNFTLTTYGAAPQSAHDKLSTSVVFSMNKIGEAKFQLATGGQVAVFNTEANTVGVVLGKPFATDLMNVLTEIQTAFSALGVPLPQTVQMISQLTASIGADKGTAPYISTRLRAE